MATVLEASTSHSSRRFQMEILLQNGTMCVSFIVRTVGSTVDALSLSLTTVRTPESVVQTL